MPQTIAIVGASLTGASAAATLREDGFDGRVVLLGAEPQLPYDRPPLSKAYLRGGMPFEKTLLRQPEFYRERNIEMRLGTMVVGVDPGPADRVVRARTHPDARGLRRCHLRRRAPRVSGAARRSAPRRLRIG